VLLSLLNHVHACKEQFRQGWEATGSLAIELIDPIQSWHKKSCLSHGYNFPCARIHPPSTRYPTSLWSEDRGASLSGKVRSKPTLPAPARTVPSRRMFDVSSAGSAKSTLKRRHRECGGEF